MIAYALGVLLTFVVVARRRGGSACSTSWRRCAGCPSRSRPAAAAGAVGLGLVGLALGALLTWSGLDGAQATPFALGLSLAIISLVPLARAAGMPERIAYTAAGALLLGWWLLPFDVMNDIAGRELSMNFSAWVVSGLMLVAGATWLIVYNADILLGATMRVAGRARSLAPMLKMAMAYPLRVRFRTGVTLAMFTLVVFTIVVGATTSRCIPARRRRRPRLRRRVRRRGSGRAHEHARRRTRRRPAQAARVPSTS